MLVSLAQVNLGTDFKLKTGNTLSNTFDPTSGIRGYISLILPNIFIVAGLILLILVVAGGIGMIISSGNPEAQQKSQGVATNAAIGFGIILGSYWIIQIIQVITGIKILG